MSNPAKLPKGRPLEGTRPRVRYSASIAAETDDQLNDWLDEMRETQPEAHGGRLLDVLGRFAVREGFRPSGKRKGRKSKGTP